MDGVIGSPQARTPLLGFELVGRGSNWRVSEVSETLLVVVQWKTRYLHRCIYEIRDTHFSSAVLRLRIVGEINCKPFLKDWKRALKIIINGSECFQFPEAVITSTAKESIRSTKHGSIQVLAVL